jgi:hypothetical protein
MSSAPPMRISEATAARQAQVLRSQSAAVARAAAGLDDAGDGGGGGGADASSSSSAVSCIVCGDARPATACCFPCGHGALVCGMCAARVRLLSGDRKCPLCKAAHEHIVVLSRAELEARGPALSFGDFGIYGSHGGPDLTLDEPSGMFFHGGADAVRREIVRLRSFRCGCAASAPAPAPAAAAAGPNGRPAPLQPPPPQQQQAARSGECAETFTSLEALLRHTLDAHSLHVCELCARNRAVFVNELPRMGAKRLQRHYVQGEPEAGFLGHPLCRFCNVRYYDDALLWTHLQASPCSANRSARSLRCAATAARPGASAHRWPCEHRVTPLFSFPPLFSYPRSATTFTATCARAPTRPARGSTSRSTRTSRSTFGASAGAGRRWLGAGEGAGAADAHSGAAQG